MAGWQNIDKPLTSVKVHAPPGGVSSISFGDDVPDKPASDYRIKCVGGGAGGASSFTLGNDEPNYPQQKQKAQTETASNVISGGQGPAASDYKIKCVGGGAGGASSFTLGNEEPQQTQQRTSVKVKNPPGGKSTFSLY